MNIDYLSSNGFPVNHKVVDLSSIMSMFTGSLTSSDDVPTGHCEEEQMKLLLCLIEMQYSHQLSTDMP